MAKHNYLRRLPCRKGNRGRHPTGGAHEDKRWKAVEDFERDMVETFGDLEGLRSYYDPNDKES